MKLVTFKTLSEAENAFHGWKAVTDFKKKGQQVNQLEKLFELSIKYRKDFSTAAIAARRLSVIGIVFLTFGLALLSKNVRRLFYKTHQSKTVGLLVEKPQTPAQNPLLDFYKKAGIESAKKELTPNIERIFPLLQQAIIKENKQAPEINIPEDEETLKDYMKSAVNMINRTIQNSDPALPFEEQRKAKFDGYDDPMEKKLLELTLLSLKETGYLYAVAPSATKTNSFEVQA